MFSIRILKKYLTVLLLTLFTAAFFQIGTGQEALAIGLSDVSDLFEAGGDKGLSFTEFEGGLATLEDTDYDESLTTSTDAREFIIRIVNFALGFLGLIAVIIVIYGGVLYVTAAGEQEKTDKGKKAITYAVIGLLIVMASFAIVNTVISGAMGGEEGEVGRGRIGANTGANFNASAAEVRAIARDIYIGFVKLAEVEEELKGIIADSNKTSLSYMPDDMAAWIEDPVVASVNRTQPVAELPRSNVLIFLNSVKGKLTNMKQKLAKFSKAYSTINNLIRVLDDKIDQVKSIPEEEVELNFKYKEYTDSSYGVGIPSGEGFKRKVAEFTGKGINIKNSVLKICADSYSSSNDPCKDYPKDLYTKWPRIKKTILSKDYDENDKENIRTIYQPLKEIYLNELKENFIKLEEIQDTLRGIEAAELGNVATLHTDMVILYGYGDSEGNVDLANLNKDNPTYTGFAKIVEDLNLKADSPDNIEAAGAMLYEALKAQLEWADKIDELIAVEARLHANVVKGSAPLVVTFDVINSIDPAGGAIIPDNIDWKQIDGSQTLDDENIDLPEDAVTDCNTGTYAEDGDLDESVVGAAFRQCTFNHPGTYIATVEIKSNNPKKYVNGRSTLVIKVLPPNTKIDMTMDAGGKTFQLMGYYPNGLLKVNKDRIAVSLKESKLGLEFDASGTNYTGTKVESYSWDFGDNSTPDYANTAAPTHIYELEGQYKVVLEVMNTLGQLDRKIVIIDVRDLAARIRVKPGLKVFTNQDVRIDAELSASSTGPIRTYDWRVDKIDAARRIVSTLIEEDRSAFNYKFTDPGKYKVYLTATNAIDESKAEEYIYVSSLYPVAKFTHKASKPNKPHIIDLNASSSFDPDGTSDNLSYEWTISPASEDGENWELIDNNAERITGINPQIKFKKKQDYEIELKVTDTSTVDEPGLEEESDVITKTITVDNILDLDWASEQDSTGKINEEMTFNIESDNGKAYEIDFGDGNSDNGDLAGREATVTHTYDTAGAYTVRLTVYDENDDDNSIQRRFLISEIDQPIAHIGMSIAGNEVFYVDEPIIIGTSDLITFDASESKNIDGTGRDLKYQWDFGDMGNSSKKIANHKYKELSPEAGFYTISLRITDKDDPTKTSTDEVQINVVNFPPKFSSVQGLVGDYEGELTAPVQVDMQVYGAEDPDGQIVKYKWWYFDVENVDEKKGVQITKQPTTKLTIATDGPEGEEKTYGFGLEITDDNNLKFSNEDSIEEGDFSQITVVNGANVLPVAKFNVSATSVFTGREIIFTSASTDEDGEIASYIWDLEGDGFSNNEATNDSTIFHQYENKNLEGYEVKLKIIDDKGGEAVSAPIKIFVDSNASAPVAAFKYKVIEGSQGMKIAFENKSTADEEEGMRIMSHKWDFDTASSLESADSDGDGTKSNDVDSEETDPQMLYTEQGEYRVKLTVTDTQGNTDDVTNTVRIPLANPPVAAFTYKIEDDKVKFENRSTADEKAEANIEKFIWDFDTNSVLDTADSDGDGVKDNDNESELESPLHEYIHEGKYKVKLTVFDNQGNSDEVSRDVSFGRTPQEMVVDETPVSDDPVAAFTYSIDEDGEINFKNHSTADDSPEVEIRDYIWDFDTSSNLLTADSNGDGFKDNDSDSTEKEPTHKYEVEGSYKIKLTVIDSNGNTDDVIRMLTYSKDAPVVAEQPISVDPTAAFTYEIDDNEVKFENNSTADEDGGIDIEEYIWDFDTSSNLLTADSDGDGYKDNDNDSNREEPKHEYEEDGIYRVKLTVIDDLGNRDEVIREIIYARTPVIDPNANAEMPTAAFVYEIDGAEVHFTNNSRADTSANASIESYVWDFDTSSMLVTADSDGDGFKDNDSDSTSINPTYEYSEDGIYRVKLTIVDSQGNKDDVVREVNYTRPVAAQAVQPDQPSQTTQPNISGFQPDYNVVDDYSADGGSIEAILSSTPAARDGFIYLNGDRASVRFDFRGSRGAIASYIIDKNILYDTDNNGIADDEEDFKSHLPGSWTTNFEKEWGRTIVRLTVEDIHGNKDIAELEIKFR